MADLIGAHVTLQDLKARPELNGRRGRVLSFSADTGRAGVNVEGEPKPLSLKPANLAVVKAKAAPSYFLPDLECAPDEKALAKFVGACSVHLSADAKRLYAAEMKAKGMKLALGGGWCCATASLWCASCAANLCYSGVDEAVADAIPKLLGLPRANFEGERRLPGELEAAVHLVDRVAALRKGIGQVCFDNLSAAEQAHVRARVAALPQLDSVEYNNQWHMSMLGLCVRGRKLADLADLAALADFYRRQELPKVAAEVERASGAALVSDYLTTWDVEENGGRGWLTGLLLGYPVWSTVARYKVGGFEGGKFTK